VHAGAEETSGVGHKKHSLLSAPFPLEPDAAPKWDWREA
jgi:hypothetical protein